MDISVNEVKELLRERGASTRGRKADLIERLDAYKKNDNFGNDIIELLPPVNIPDWPSAGYKQLSLNHREVLPDIRMQHINHYFLHRQVAEQTSRDLKSIEKGKDLLESKRVDACSFAVKGDAVFITGLVRAAMKKKVSYSCKVKLNMRGELVNSHCECPGGKGPHGTCKHISAVCIMIHEFKQTGELSTNSSCTDILQNFHHPVKKYTGSPVKAENLEIPSKYHTCLDDPRPLKRRRMAGWSDFVRNQVINFTHSKSGEQMACSYLWRQANIKVAMIDHDYCKLPFVEYWIEKSNYVDEQKRLRIEEATRHQADCEKWHCERKWRITASQFGTVINLTPRRDINKLCQSLLSPPKLMNSPIPHGLQYEAIAIDKFSEVTGQKVKPCGLYISMEFPFLAATPDGVINTQAIVEVKCPYSGRNEKITVGKCFPYLVNDDKGQIYLKRKHHYFDQIQGQLFITNCKWCFFVVYTFCDFKIIRIGFDEDYCRSSLIPKLQCFYKKYYRPYIAQNIYKM